MTSNNLQPTKHTNAHITRTADSSSSNLSTSVDWTDDYNHMHQDTTTSGDDRTVKADNTNN